MQRKIKNKGFTLVEILVSIVVLGVLSGIGYPVYQDYVAKGQIGQLAPLLAESRLDVESHAMLSGQLTLNKTKSEFDPKLLASQTIKDGVITFTFKDGIGSRLSGKKYSFTPIYEDKNISWSCETDVNTKIDPFHCKSLIGGVNVGDIIASFGDGKVKVVINHAGGETVTCAGMDGGSNFEYNGSNYYVAKDDADFLDYVYNEDRTIKDSFLNGKVCTTHVTSMSGFFSRIDLGDYDISDWDTSNVTNMASMFERSKFNSDISGWDVSNVTNMELLFERSKFNSDISGWDVSNVTNMESIFSNSQFNGDISGWNVSNVTNMASMFYNSQFNGDISGWDTSNVTNMKSIFSNSQFNGDISGWNVSNVTNMDYAFRGSEFNQDIIGWDVSGVTSMRSMFFYSQFNGDISGWDVSNVTNMESIFSNSQFNGDISGWDVSKVKSMISMFDGNDGFNQDLSGWCVSNIKSKPTNFDHNTSSWVNEHKPVWGTCPKG